MEIVNGALDANGYKPKLDRLQKIIGNQAIQIEILKKDTHHPTRSDL